MTFDGRVRLRHPARLADYPRSARFGPRTGTDFELVWIVRGAATWTRWLARSDDTGATETLAPGQVALAVPGDVDSYHWSDAGPTTHGYLHFVLDDVAPAGWEPRVCRFADQPMLTALCQYLVDLGALSGKDPAVVARSERVVALILDIMYGTPRLRDRGAENPTWTRILDQVRLVWRRSGMRAIGVAELSRGTHLSPGHLHRLFRSRYGIGPAHALELVRLARAATTLQRSAATITEVSSFAGFANPYHFSRRFRIAYGVPPTRFRAKEVAADPTAPLRDHGLLDLAARLGSP